MIFRNKRSELEIIDQILSLATEDIKKTPLMYQTNLCYNLFNEYMGFLLEKEFLGVKECNPIGKIYYTTEKGKKFIENIKNVLYQVR